MVDHPDSRRTAGLWLKLGYSMRALAREIGWDRGKLQRELEEGGVVPRRKRRKSKTGPKLIWICDIRREMPEFYESWTLLRHEAELARMRATGGRVATDEREDDAA